ncbi:MAG TPA: glycoside hydrolase family 127 protein, partial [Anaerolineales bacterium]|nr:glycoside hydrolase family 127 protein [Anaerolineales bacterium]
SRQPLSQDDIQLPHLLNADYRFKAHGVHTYEHLRSLLTAAFAANNPQMDSVLAAALAKLEPCITPSGAPIGDEFIAGREANASETGYEYCSIHELFDTYAHLLQKTGDLHWADRAEWLFFNAAQGARHPAESSIAYLKTDNSFSMTGPLHPDDPQDEHNPQIRYKYSPVHQDVAVCCVPNAGRISPYYVKAMWLRSSNGLVKVLYGTSQLQTEIEGVTIKIKETTDYPFDTEITFHVEVSQPIEFTMSFRKPEWSTGLTLTGADEFSVQENLIQVRKNWQAGDQLSLRFEADVKIQPWRNESIIRYGALLFCLPLDGDLSRGREYAPSFADLYYTLTHPTAVPQPALASQSDFTLEQNPLDPSDPFSSLTLRGNLLNDGHSYPVQLIPLGGSILRRVTF